MLINLLPLLEAKDSSEIENIVTTTDKLFQYALETRALIMQRRKLYATEQRCIKVIYNLKESRFAQRQPLKYAVR